MIGSWPLGSFRPLLLLRAMEAAITLGASAIVRRLGIGRASVYRALARQAGAAESGPRP